MSKFQKFLTLSTHNNQSTHNMMQNDGHFKLAIRDAQTIFQCKYITRKQLFYVAHLKLM